MTRFGRRRDLIESKRESNWTGTESAKTETMSPVVVVLVASAIFMGKLFALYTEEAMNESRTI